MQAERDASPSRRRSRRRIASTLTPPRFWFRPLFPFIYREESRVKRPFHAGLKSTHVANQTVPLPTLHLLWATFGYIGIHKFRSQPPKHNTGLPRAVFGATGHIPLSALVVFAILKPD